VPIFVNRYEPVFWSNIGSKGFPMVTIEQGAPTKEAVDEVRRRLLAPELRRTSAEHNFGLGERHFSDDTLQCRLELLFDAP